MVLKYDPEWAQAAAPVLAMMSNAPKIPVGDALGRRNMVSSAFGALIDAMPDFPDVETQVFKTKSYDGAEIEIYRFHKTGAPSPAAILHIHGGGMIAGTAAMFAKGAKAMVSTSGTQFFSVDYRLAPEHQDPVLVEDCYAGLVWLHEHAAEFGVDPARIGTMGESAGGGLAAGLTLLARDRKLQPPLAKQILVYPMLDSRNITNDNAELAPFLMWDVNSNITGWSALLGDKMGTEAVSAYASPAHAKDLSNLPSTYMDCGNLDLFRDEDTTYAARLAAANVDVEYHLYPGLPHGFEALSATSAAAQKAFANRVKALTSF